VEKSQKNVGLRKPGASISTSGGKTTKPQGLDKELPQTPASEPEEPGPWLNAEKRHQRAAHSKGKHISINIPSPRPTTAGSEDGGARTPKSAASVHSPFPGLKDYAPKSLTEPPKKYVFEVTKLVTYKSGGDACLHRSRP
jgi:hypothetical protein